MSHGIAISLAPTATHRDALRALCFLLAPWHWISGPFPARLEKEFQDFFGVPTVIVLTSGRWALFALLRALRCVPGDEVLLQAYTCVSVPGPVLWAGAKPVYVDIDPATLTMEPADLRRKITPRSRAIIVQHTFGCPAPLEEIRAIARERNLVIIEDCAHVIGARYNGERVGTLGDAAIMSFGRDKAISSVFGGALVVKNPQRFPGITEELRTLPVARRWWVVQQLLHPVVLVFLVRPLYFVFGIGKALLVLAQRTHLVSRALTPGEKSGGRPSAPYALFPNALAALAAGQFQRLAAMNERRTALAAYYRQALADLPLRQPEFPAASEPIWLRYTVQTKHAAALRLAARHDRLLLGDWYNTVIAPRDTDLSSVGYVPGSCPVAEQASAHSLNLPTNPGMSLTDGERVQTVLRALLKELPP